MTQSAAVKHDIPFRLSVCGKDEIDGYAHHGVTHILSLEDPRTPKETPPWFHGVHWQLHFHDVESIEEAQVVDGTAVTEKQVAAILRAGADCLKASQGEPVHLLVHCLAGISRSTAACYAILAEVLGPGHAEQALEYVRRIRPEAFPNLLVVKHADRLLGRGGELLRALASLRSRWDEDSQPWVDILRQRRGDLED
jgi:predicted protein tyrosine phosphatase